MIKIEEKVLIKIITYLPLIFIPVIVLIVLLMNIAILESNHNITVENFTKNIMEKKDEILKTKIDSLVNYIEYQNSLIEKTIKSNVKNEVQKVYVLASQIYKNNKNKKSSQEIQELIKDVVASFNQHSSVNHIQIISFDGTLVLAPPYIKHLQNKSLLDYKDIIGKYPIREEIALAKRGEGYILDTFEIFGVHKNMQQVVYVKPFKPYNWYFKATAYFEDKNKDESKNIIQAVKKIEQTSDDNIFVIDYDGNILLDAANPEIEGKNIYDLKGKNFLDTYSKILKFVANNSKGFVSYKWFNPKINKLELRSMYISEIKDTNWIVGSGYYKSDIEKIVTLQVQEMDKEYKKQFNHLIQFGTIALLLFILLSFIISRYIKNSFASYRGTIELKTNELVDSNKQLESKIRELNDAQNMLVESEKLASLGALVAGVSHEINTPIGIALTGISNIEYETNLVDKLYKEEELTEEKLVSYIKLVTKLSKTIHTSLSNAIRLIQSFKKISVDQHSGEKRIINLSKYFDEIVLSLNNSLKQKRVVVLNNIDKDIELETYAGIYSQIFSNLILNTLKHAFNEKERDNIIEVYTIVTQNNLEIHFKDNGKGIDKNIKNKIFDPFFTTKRGQGGSGLGLNIIHNLILKKLHGTISIVDIKNGLHICFSVPYTKMID
ncbi:MAG TPA: hypothetical protein EYH11_05390 [Sulfurimonas autotrophica]|nr:hypothetical protein [Sulfurimonas autotrophica]